MKQIAKKIAAVAAIFLFIATSSMAQSIVTKVDVSVFPEAEKGYKKMVIEVPHSNNDNNKKIEFTVGTWVEVDECNLHNLQGNFANKELTGWGYNYFVFSSNGDIMSTRKACPDNKMIRKFVTAPSQTVDYNGRMPIVVYVPEKYDVQFRIFTSDGDNYRAQEVYVKKK